MIETIPEPKPKKYGRYDKAEDRDNDVKGHDNPKHHSGYANKRDLADAEDRERELPEDDEDGSDS